LRGVRVRRAREALVGLGVVGLGVVPVDVHGIIVRGRRPRRTR
jgi:hypothetical protein